jgi:hypothetical protein
LPVLAVACSIPIKTHPKIQQPRRQKHPTQNNIKNMIQKATAAREQIEPSQTPAIAINAKKVPSFFAIAKCPQVKG